ncbi:ion transporter [Maricaulis parjimensis]|uniref:ion transporter n=1 Tax=Maricaulis parjimensis TaxID=144023 RepID=UPI001EED145E|nr:ion transporter [Maricaulis parjimensis]
MLTAIVESALFRNFIMTLIVINAVTLGLETYPYDGVWFTNWMPLLDRIIVSVFVIEIVMKLIAYRHRFFLNGWNWFDLAVIIISVMPSAGGFSVLRALRIIRAFRLFSVMPDLRKVVEALLRAIPGMGAVIAVLGLMFYVSAVMATKLFGAEAPDRFGTLGDSAFALFQVMTLEGWASDVALPVMEDHPWAWIFFVVFIVLTSFAVLNLFIAIIVDSLQAKHFDDEEARDAEADADRDLLHAEVADMKLQIIELKELVQRSLSETSSTDSKADDKSE